jgi:hypothetical protein
MALTVQHRARFPYAFSRADVPYATPAEGAALRLAFVGQSTYFEACALDEQSEHIRTTFIDFRELGDADAMVRAVRRADPHVIVMFRPDIVPPGAFHGLGAATVGFLTEPIPRKGGEPHPDLDKRLDDTRRVDPTNFDRIVAFDPLLVETAESITPVWRSVALPVADRYYRDVQPIRGTPRMLFVGRSTIHREAWLVNPKHFLDVFHVAHGVDADRLESLFDEHDVGINLHNEAYESFENRVCLHLAAGHLVVTEKLNPTHGLEPGIDYLEVDHPDRLLDVLYTLQRFPAMYDRVRVRGRMKAEQFRASEVWPKLVHDLYSDLSAFGTNRS